MLLKPCIECKHGEIKEESSFCSKEGCFSHHTNCVRHLAMEYFIGKHIVFVAECGTK